MNKLILIGRLTADPETRTGTGTTITRYTLAVDRRFKRDGEPEADFFNCTAFGKSAEFADKYFKKGIKIVVVGRMEQDNYTNKDGNKVYAWKVIVEEQEFAESKAASAQATESAPVAKAEFVDLNTGIDDDLPFI